MRDIFLLLLIFSALIACNNAPDQGNKIINLPPDILSEAAGVDYSDKIRIPVSAFGPEDTSAMPKIEFEAPEFVFDTIIQGEKLEHSFQFTNTGNAELFILDTRVSCGCTVASYPEEGILPGEKGEINVTFDSSNKYKEQNRNIIIISNTYPNESSVQLRGFVKDLNN